MPTVDIQRNLMAGTPPADTTNSASIGVNSSTNMMEVNSGALRQVVPTYINTQTSISGVGNGADATDDTLFSFSLPAALLASNNQAVRVRASGVFAGNGNNKTVKIFFGATAVATTGVVTNNGTHWHAEAIVYRTAAATQLGDGLIWTALLPFPTKSAPGETLSGAVVVKVTGASPTTNAANDVLGHTFSVEAVGIY